MKISTYTYVFKSSKYGALIYNSITNAFAKLNEPLFDLLLQAKNKPVILKELDSETLLILKKAKIIVEKHDELNQFYQKRLLYYLTAFSSDSLSLTIAPTTACNFACPYCYEKGIDYRTMNDIVINDLIEFIKKHDKIQGLGITWYGGEPLLAIDKIEKILIEIKKLNIKIYNNSIVTNGFYLNSNNQDFIIKNSFNSMQITLDGATAQAHNNRRFLKTGGETWNTILLNLDMFFKKFHNIRVDIRCNIDNKNQEEFLKLKVELNKRWNNNPNVNIYPGILTNNENDNNSTTCNYMTGKDVSKFHLNLGIKEKTSPYFNFEYSSCGATCINSYVVGPEGELYKCWNDIGHNEMIIGYLNKDKNITNNKVLFQYLGGPTLMDEKKCKDCVLFFVCSGGCIWMRIKNKMEGTKYDLCNYRKNNINEFLELHYEKKIKETV